MARLLLISDARLLLRPSSKNFVEGVLKTSNYKFDQYIALPLYSLRLWHGASGWNLYCK